MDGLIIFKTKVENLKDSSHAGLNIPVYRKELIVKKVIRRLRVFLELDTPPNQDVLKRISASLELPGGIDGTGVDLVCLATLENPDDTTLPTFYNHVDTLKTKWESNADEDIEFKSTFP